MQYIPKKTKYKKQRKGRLLNFISKPILLNNISKGSIALRAIESGRLTSKHINVCKQTINKMISKKLKIKSKEKDVLVSAEKKMKKYGQLKINFFPHTPITKKPLEIRMGKGKGNVDHWASNIFTGNLLLEIESSNIPLCVQALKVVQGKLPINTKIVFENV